MKNIILCLFLLVFIPIFSYAQGVTITGTVTNAKNQKPFEGVNIKIQGYPVGTVTGADGSYSIIVPRSNFILIFSYVGFVPQKTYVGGGRHVIDIVLKEDISLLGGAVVIGSRFLPRSSFTSPVPIENIQLSDIKASGQFTLEQMLNSSTQSFNASQQTVSDATAHFNPAELRSLGPSRTLVLINGKRKNLSSLVYINDTPGKGDVGVDWGSIPSNAVKRVSFCVMGHLLNMAPMLSRG